MSEFSISGLCGLIHISNTNKYPWNIICYLRGVGSEKTLHGSGVLIDPNTVLTVAHNLFDKENVSIFGKFEAPRLSVFPGGVQSGISSIPVTSGSFKYR